MILNQIFFVNNLQQLKGGLPYVSKNTININFKWAAQGQMGKTRNPTERK